MVGQTDVSISPEPRHCPSYTPGISSVDEIPKEDRMLDALCERPLVARPLFRTMRLNNILEDRWWLTFNLAPVKFDYPAFLRGARRAWPRGETDHARRCDMTLNYSKESCKKKETFNYQRLFRWLLCSPPHPRANNLTNFDPVRTWCKTYCSLETS